MIKFCLNITTVHQQTLIVKVDHRRKLCRQFGKLKPAGNQEK